jgi:hypothetical protein
MEAQHEHDVTKQETVDENGQSLANVHTLRGHMDEQIQVEGELSDKKQKRRQLTWLP